MALITPPLALAAAEVRLPYSPLLVSTEGFQAAQRALSRLTLPRKQAEGGFTLTDRDLTTQLTWTDSAVILTTTAYNGFNEFTDLLSAALSAVAEVTAPPAVERVGLRFINELRPPLDDGSSLEKWRPWLNPAVLSFADGVVSATSSADADLTGFQAVFTVPTGNQHAVTVRIQAINGPPVVGNSPLQRTLAANGPFVALDLDGYWDGKNSQDPFTPEAVSKSVDTLHGTIEEIFLWATTSEFRKEAGL